MVFSSYLFLLVFLPVVLAGYYLLSRVENSLYQRLFLIAASLVFYGYYNVRYLALITASIAVNYLAALRIRKTGSKVCLVLGILFNVGLIGYFKYFDFFLENLNLLAGTAFPLQHILLPLGISFFTFQQLSFLVSVYKGEEQVGKLRDYCLFVLFFPQLVAGPIVLYSEMIPQFKDPEKRWFSWENFARGCWIFCIGLFKKAVIADTLAIYANAGFGTAGMTFAAAWVTSLSYTLQIYFDFSGYSDMAVGLGRMFNIVIPFNFRSPYQSKSITEFWRRWHITLGRALSTYVYRPLGGNRRGLARTCINLFATFLVSGLWHGASWNFVLWGALHGAFMVFERLAEPGLKKIPNWLRIGITFFIVNALWVLFRAETISQAMDIYRSMAQVGQLLRVPIPELIASVTALAADNLVFFPVRMDMIAIAALLGVLLAVVFFGENSADRLERFRPSGKTAFVGAVLLTAGMMCLSRESIFIYFNF